jgi:hypothetical protein
MAQCLCPGSFFATLNPSHQPSVSIPGSAAIGMGNSPCLAAPGAIKICFLDINQILPGRTPSPNGLFRNGNFWNIRTYEYK